jgi:hypothetical protein
MRSFAPPHSPFDCAQGRLRRLSLRPSDSNLAGGYLRLPAENREPILISIVFNVLAQITLVVLLPSERLPLPGPPPIIDLLWLMFSVRFRVEIGRAQSV